MSDAAAVAPNVRRSTCLGPFQDAMLDRLQHGTAITWLIERYGVSREELRQWQRRALAAEGSLQ